MNTIAIRALRLGLALAWLLTAAGQAVAEDWPQFRGPEGDGISTATNLPLTWNESSNVAWKVSLPGRGRSSPIIAGSRIWVTSALEANPRKGIEGSDPVIRVDRAEPLLLCFERTSGKKLFEVKLHNVQKPQPAHEFNSYATPTPVLEGNRIYCDMGDYGTTCLEADSGQVVWTNRLKLDHQLGPGSSPVLWRDKLIVVRDGRDRQFIAALDKNTGRLVWETNRPPITAGSGNAKKSFSTPLLIDAAGRPQVVIPAAHWVVSYDPDSGAELWRFKHGTGFSIGPRPVAGKGLVYALTGMTRNLLAIRPGGRGDVTSTHLAWKVNSVVGTMPSPLLVGNEIYCVNDQGLMTVLDAQTGNELGKRGLGGPCSSSPLLANGCIYMFTQKGKGIVLRPGRELEVLGQSQVEGAVFASPAAVDQELFVRTDSHLYCIKKAQ